MTRWGVLGAARINQLVLEGAALAEGAAVTAIAARDSARAHEQASQWGIARVHHDYEALLADPDIDAVYIPLPNSLHVPWSIRALQAGKHVLCEKPLARSESEARRAFEAARAADRLLMEAFMWRHTPQTRRLGELAREVGPIRELQSTFGFKLERSPDVRLSAELEGGALMDVGCYCVSGARLLLGEPESAEATQVTGGEGVDVHMNATLRFAGGALATFECALDEQLGHDLRVRGDGGELVLADPWHANNPGIERDGERIEVPYANAYALELENFSAAIRGEAEPLLGEADAIGQARAIEMLYAAAGAV
jgi:predicted dehydrogenase